MPTHPSTAAARVPSASRPGPARCEARGRRPGVLGGSLPRACDPARTPFSASTSPIGRPSGSRSPATSRGSSEPEKAELPKRLRRSARPPRRPSRPAPASGAGAGPRRTRLASRRARPSRRVLRRATPRREPSRGASRVPGRARPPHPGTSKGFRPRRPPASGRARRAAPRGRRGPPPTPRPQATRRAPAGPPVRRSSSRRSAITRPASIAGALPPPPSISAHPLAPQRLPEAVGAAATQREHLQVGRVELEPVRPHLLVERPCTGARSARGRRRARSRSRPAGRRPRRAPARSRTPSRAARSRARWTPGRRTPRRASRRSPPSARRCARRRPGIGSTRASHPSSSNHVGELPRGRAPGCAPRRSRSTDAPGLDDHHVAALDRAGGRHAARPGSRPPGRSGSRARTRRGATIAGAG